jgi:hypothetical protein
MSIADRILEEGRQEEENEQGSWNEHYRPESYKYNHETGLFEEETYNDFNNPKKENMSIENKFLEEEIKELWDDIDHDLEYYEHYNYQPKKQEIMKDVFIKMSDDNNYEMLSEHSEVVPIQEQENINQNNYKMSNNLTKTKMKKVENNTEVKIETKKEALRRLYIENGLTEEDIYKDKRGFVIITRTGIDKIVSKQKITVAYEVISMDIEKGYCVLKAVASMNVNGEARNMMSFGESADNNLMGGGKKFPVAMAEKRAMSRVVLKIAGFYEQGVFGQDEIVD